MGIEKKGPFLPSDQVLSQEVNGETVLLDLESESYFGLDSVGTRIWTMLNEGRELAEMIDVLIQEYEVERETLEQDVNELLASLLEAGLIKSERTQW